MNTSNSDYEKPLRELFKEIMALNSADNEVPSELYFHAFMGAVFKDKKIRFGITNKDMRVPISWIQNSRTGIRCAIITDYSAAGIIGSLDEEAIRFNNQYINDGLCRENPEIEIVDKNNKKKTIKWRDPVIRGDAGTYDIIIFDEMSILLNPKNKQNSEILSILQPALDSPPYVRKKLRHAEPIEYSHPVTIVGTTFFYGDINKTIAESGYLQRTFVYIRKLSINELRKMRGEELKLNDPKIKSLVEKKMDIFVKRLNKIKEHTINEFYIDESAKDELKVLNEYFLNMIEKSEGPSREMLISFSNTFTNMAQKMAAQYVAIHGKTEKITGLDIRRSRDRLKDMANSVFKHLDIRESKEIEKEILTIKRKFKQQLRNLGKDFLNLKEFGDVLQCVYTDGRDKREQKAKDLASAGYFRVEKGIRRELKFFVR